MVYLTKYGLILNKSIVGACMKTKDQLEPPDIVDKFTKTGGQPNENEFTKWRAKFKNLATYLYYKDMERNDQ
jgi:hypothetical protein